MVECTHQRQRITFSGVKTYHTNGTPERMIRSLYELSRDMIFQQIKDGRAQYMQTYDHMISRWQHNT